MRHCSYNQRDFGLEDVKRTLRNIYADNLARFSSHGKSVVGRGVAMHAQGDSSGVKCFNCSEYRHCRKESPQNCDAKKRGPNRGKPKEEQPRWRQQWWKGGSRRWCRWPWARRGS